MGDDTEKRIDDLYKNTAPYLSDLVRSKEIIRKAFESGDPEDYLEDMLHSDEEMNPADIRIILNRLRRRSSSI